MELFVHCLSYATVMFLPLASSTLASDLDNNCTKIEQVYVCGEKLVLCKLGEVPQTYGLFFMRRSLQYVIFTSCNVYSLYDGPYYCIVTLVGALKTVQCTVVVSSGS